MRRRVTRQLSLVDDRLVGATCDVCGVLIETAYCWCGVCDLSLCQTHYGEGRHGAKTH